MNMPAVDAADHCDVAIAGAGPVGLSLAALLARQSELRICVIDARTRSERPAGIDARVFALSRASQYILDHAGAWLHLAPYAWPYRRMRVWDAALPYGEDRGLTFDAAELGEPDLGHIAENARIEWALREAVSAHARIELISPARIVSLETTAEGAILALDNGRVLRARLVAGADGAASTTRVLAQIEIRAHDYRQRGVVTHVTTAASHRETAWQRFLPTGPLALLPLGDGRSCVIWSADEPLAEELLGLDDAAFRSRLGEATEHVLGEIVAAEPRRAFALQWLHAKRYTARRVVLLGDAAHVVHPLAGQGLNLGLLDAATLAQCLASDGDPGERRTLRRYERIRKGENLLMLGALDALQRVFSMTFAPAARLRAAGVQAVNSTPPLRRHLMRRALGIAGELPGAARQPAEVPPRGA